jgi:hypothetical protein
MKKQWLIAVTAAVALVGSLAFVQARGNGAGDGQAGPPSSTQTAPPGQPIAFPHDIHVTDNQIDCQFCHFSAERSSSAGIPAVATCMGCHTFVSGTENPDQVELLRGFANRGEPIPWVRIYKVVDHVQFPHMRHVSAGVDCASCHGAVEEIGVIQEVAQPLTMGWCLSCHLEEGASRDCTVCHY